MEFLKSFVITLVSTIVFMTIIEIISPDNNMKKYIKFVLGLVLIAILIDPILIFFNRGEEILKGIVLDYNDYFFNNKETGEEKKSNIDAIKNGFEINLNENCNNILKNKYPNYNFQCESKVEINSDNLDFEIINLDVMITKGQVKKVNKINISKEEKNENDILQKEIKKYLSKELDLKEKSISIKYWFGGYNLNLEKLKKDFKKFINNKKINGVLIAILIILFLLLSINILFPKQESEKIVSTDKEVINSEKTEYEQKERNDLTNILRKIEGVGEVEVKINFESDFVKVPAYEKNTQTSTTEETDTEGGVRKNNQVLDNSTVVMATDKPYILQTYKPKVIGIVVVAKGASDSKVKHNIELAVSNLYNLSANKVNVYPMK